MKISKRTLRFIVGGAGAFLMGWLIEDRNFYKRISKEKDKLIEDQHKAILEGTEALDKAAKCHEELFETVLNSGLLSEEQKTELEFQKSIRLAREEGVPEEQIIKSEEDLKRFLGVES